MSEAILRDRIINLEKIVLVLLLELNKLDMFDKVKKSFDTQNLIESMEGVE